MLIGITISRYGEVHLSELLPIAAKFGVQFVEFNRSLLDEVENVCAHMQNIQSGYHLPLVEEDGYDFSSPDHAAEIDRVIFILNRNKEKLHLRYALTHPPYSATRGELSEKTCQVWIENLQRLQVPVLLENVRAVSESQFDQLVAVLREKLGERFWGLCFDGPHSYLNGEAVLQRFHALSSQIKCIHLSDCSQTEDLHLPFNQGGVFPIESFLKEVKLSGIASIINLEIDPGSLSNLGGVINSYLQVLKIFQPLRYYSNKLRLLWMLPAIKAELKKLFSKSSSPALESAS